MATVTLNDGSKLELEGSELLLYLQATGQTVTPKSEAERIAERMIELRNMDVSDVPVTQLRELMTEHNALSKIEEHDKRIEESLRESAVHTAAQDEANATGEPVEIGNFVVMPGGRVLPKHVRPGGIPPRPQRHIPFTKNELPVMNVLKVAYPGYLTTAQVAERMGETNTARISSIISAVFNSGRGVKKGAHHTWSLEIWAYRAVWVQDGTPSRRWPPKEEGDC